MMKRKQLVSLAMAAVMAGSLAGCGGGAASEGSSEGASSQAADAGTQAQGDGAEEAAEGQTVLKWAMWDKDLTAYYDPLVSAYEEANPDVKIELVDLGSSDYQTVLATQLTGSGSDFDVVSVKDVPGYVTLVNKGVLESLDSYIEKDSFDLTGYKGLEEQVNIGGQIYELPFKSDFWVVFYNKDVFDNAGVAYPTNDMTFEEYDALARSISNPEPGSEVYGAHYHTWRSTVQLFGTIDGEHSVLDGTYDFLKPYYETVLAEQEDM